MPQESEFHWIEEQLAQSAKGGRTLGTVAQCEPCDHVTMLSFCHKVQFAMLQCINAQSESQCAIA